jgi:hypothetical protein
MPATKKSTAKKTTAKKATKKVPAKKSAVKKTAAKKGSAKKAAAKRSRTTRTQPQAAVEEVLIVPVEEAVIIETTELPGSMDSSMPSEPVG